MILDQERKDQEQEERNLKSAEDEWKKEHTVDSALGDYDFLRYRCEEDLDPELIKDLEEERLKQNLRQYEAELDWQAAQDQREWEAEQDLLEQSKQELAEEKHAEEEWHKVLLQHCFDRSEGDDLELEWQEEVLLDESAKWELRRILDQEGKTKCGRKKLGMCLAPSICSLDTGFLDEGTTTNKFTQI